MATSDKELLARVLTDHASKSVLVVTGAGVSAPSGLKTFRGSEPDALWRRDPQELATRAFFELDPVTHWRWYTSRFAAVDTARPNAAHQALVEYERKQVAEPSRSGEFLLVTQNIDTLHEQAGSRRLVKVHGTADRLRCSRLGCASAAPRGSIPRAEVDLQAFRAAPGMDSLPRCGGCGAVLRPHVLFFDESYDEHVDYGFDRVQEAAWAADVVLFVGTSMSVGITDLVFRAGHATGATMLLVDPEPRVGAYGAGLGTVRAAAEEVLPAAIAAL